MKVLDQVRKKEKILKAKTVIYSLVASWCCLEMEYRNKEAF